MTHRIRLTLLFLAVACLPLGPVPAASAQAGTNPPAVPAGGGTVTTCTEAGLDARLAGGGIVTFSCGGAISFFLSTTKTITQPTTVDGTGGITLDGSDSIVIFSVQPGVTLTLKNLTLNEGNGGANDGGAIRNHGILRLDHTTIQSSRTDSNHSGGAIFSDGPVSITDSLIQNNQAGSAGALFANFDQAQVTVSNTTFFHNLALNGTTGYGGAIWVGEQAQLSITGGALLTNSAKYGGGLYLSPNATVTVSSSGAPAIVSGNSATLTGGGISNSAGRVTVTNAAFSGNSAETFGGGIDNSGGWLTLANTTLSGNSAGYGGALANAQITGTATLMDDSLSGNLAHFEGGGLYNDQASAALTNVILAGNTVTNTIPAPTYGGGIANYGVLTLTNSTLNNNTAAKSQFSLSFGGGLYNNKYDSHDTALILNSTFSGNSANDGGGIVNVGTLTLTNSTLGANVATNLGGALENYHAKALLTNDTFSGNSAGTGGGVYQLGVAPTETTTIKNSVIASGLSGANCYEDPGSFGSLLSAGYNLSNEGTCTPFFNQTSDVNNQNPNLGPLADNGGPTLTQLPNLPSAAIDAIPNGTNGCGTTLLTDQRGALRPFHSRCDIGAVEATFSFARLWLPLLRR